MNILSQLVGLDWSYFYKFATLIMFGLLSFEV